LKSAALQYANALADIALEQGAVEPLVKQLAEFTALFGESAELRSFLASPAIARPAKHGVIEKIATRAGASKVLRNFLFVLTDNQRTHILAEIEAAFGDVLRQRQGIAQAEVTSAAELSAAQKKELLQALERVTGKKIEPRYALDPALLGGAIVRVGSTVYDGSVRNRLARMRARLASE
jgi:F-type H+-transporting ATPase subunit delta